MSGLRVEWARRALKELARLDARTQARIVTAVEALADHRGDVRRLRGTGDETLRLRVGDWRVIFSYQDSAILILRIRARGAAYKP